MTMTFNASMSSKTPEFLNEEDAIEKRLRTVMKLSQFSIFLQSIVSIKNHATVGFEALARFDGEPYRSPSEWFDDAKKVHLDEELDRLLLKAALTHLDKIPASSYLSLNVRPGSLCNGSISAALANYNLDRIVLEITEHDSIRDYDLVRRELEPLRQSGLRIAVDDVGSGYACFSHILNLKPDYIKLDAELIRGIDTNSEKRMLLESIMHFARGADYQVIAEGVETDSELNILRHLEVNKAQGYLIGRPKPIELLG